MERETVSIAARIPSEIYERIEGFCELSGYDRISHGVKVLIEAGLEAAENGIMDLEQLKAVQHNSNAEALSRMYGILADVVDRL